jgi:hypothetical protein
MIFTPTIAGYTGTIEVESYQMMANIHAIMESGLLDASNKKENFKAYVGLMMNVAGRVKAVDVTRSSDAKKFDNGAELFDSDEGFKILHELTDAAFKVSEFKKMYDSVEAKRAK